MERESILVAVEKIKNNSINPIAMTQFMVLRFDDIALPSCIERARNIEIADLGIKYVILTRIDFHQNGNVYESPGE